MRDLEIAAVRDGRLARVAVSGDVDLVSADQLADTLVGLHEQGASRLELDMLDVTFIDSSGVRALLKAECEVRVVRASRQVVRLFQAIALDDLLD